MSGIDQFLTVPDVAAALAVSVRSVWREIERGRLSAHRFGRATRVSRTELAAYVQRCCCRGGRQQQD